MRFFNGIDPVAAPDNEKSSTYSILSANLATKVQLGPAQSSYPDALYSKLEELTKESISTGYPVNSSLDNKHRDLRKFNQPFKHVDPETPLMLIPFMLLSKPGHSDWRNLLPDDRQFMIGCVTAKSTRSNAGLDSIAYRFLKDVGSGSTFKIKSRSTVYDNWQSFFYNIPDLAQKSKDRLVIPATISLDKKVIRGEFTLDSTALPTSFRPGAQVFRKADDSADRITALNAVLLDFHRRRAMAKAYLVIPQSKLLSRETFRKVFEALYPYIQDGEDHPTWEFDKLMGGRNPVRSIMEVQFKNSSPAAMELSVERCMWCNFPIHLGFTQQSLKAMSSLAAGPTKAATLASEALADEHQSNGCQNY